MLTEKQKRFCEEYTVDLNATQAAVRAGYSEKTAKSIGQRLLTNVDVQTYIAELQQKISERTGVTADQVVRELARIGFSDITNYLKIRGTRRTKAVEVFNTDKLGGDLTAAISEIRQTKDGISIKLHSKTDALDMLAKHLGMMINKNQFVGKDGLPLDSDTMRAVVILPDNGRGDGGADSQG